MAHDINPGFVHLINGYYKLYIGVFLDELNDLLGLRADTIVGSYD